MPAEPHKPRPRPTPKRVFVLEKAEDILSAIEQELGDQPRDGMDARNAFLAQLRAVHKRAQNAAETDLYASGKGRRCAHDLCAAQDEIIRAIFRFASEHVYPVNNRSSGETLSIAAVGGYGRGTLAPGSDIDLLFVLPYKQTPWGESVTEYILYMLWDMGLKVGHAVRAIDDCIRMAQSDMTVRTATLEARFLTGDRSLFDTLEKRFFEKVVSGTGPEFIAAKLAERDARHAAMGDTRYVVEPDIKEGKGGLRDLDTLFWIGKYFFEVKSAKELVGKGVFSATELRRFRRSEDFLWAIRCHLHFLTGRSGNKLTFELQRELADRVQFAGRHGLMGVERLMKRYFLVAKDVGDLTRIFCASLEFEHAKDVDVIGRVMRRISRRKKIKGETDFVIEHGRISVADDGVFVRDPVNLIRIFAVAGREGLLFHPDALTLITRSMRLIDKDLRKNPQANAYFLDILTHGKSVERILRRMNESGVLGKFVTEFGRVVALMQFNMYHHYTVDEHLIRAVGVFGEITEGGLTDELPLTHELLPHLADKRLLFVALFLHDIAKGRREHHSVAGARLAKKLCPRFGLDAAETETVVWLVRHHLDMSEIAQSRDIQDPETARRFADEVQSLNRLNLLLILTACDIRAVGPGVWTGWKGSLLRALYYATEPLLSGGHSQVAQIDRVAEARDALIEALKGDFADHEISGFVERQYTAYWLRAEHELQIDHARMVRKAERAGEPFAGFHRVKAFEAVTEISFFTPDHPRLLSVIAGACTLADANIIGAQIFSTRDGYALDTFRVKRAFTGDEDERIRAERIIQNVKQLLHGQKYLPKGLGLDSRHNKRLRPFSVPAEVQISNSLSRKFTVIEVSGLDRTGLLYDLTRALSDLSLTIGSAHIATYGEKAVDVFYVTDLTGMRVENKARQKRIRDKLMAALDPAHAEEGAERHPAIA
ncbi:[protein-PII] uridylyltransferase [Cucumibacter marinus]|uniref:[protein-PII] uridylyltransferase n=1 Tax=Cucumibacter marinus TaxID=1121252 RepID=UPI0009DC1AD8|nr:[protein-PII] uridylyltransferase [Cucumibacter marinus]